MSVYGRNKSDAQATPTARPRNYCRNYSRNYWRTIAMADNRDYVSTIFVPGR